MSDEQNNPHPGRGEGEPIDRDWLIKVIREHTFAQDAADMILEAFRRAPTTYGKGDGLLEKVARICGGSTVENMGTHPFKGDAADLDWSSWQFAAAILALPELQALQLGRE